MVLLDFVARLSVAVLAMLAFATLVCLDRAALDRAFRTFDGRLREVAPHLLLLGAVLAINKVAREVGPSVSWVLDLNITGVIYAVEGDLVGTIQSIQGSLLTAYFSYMYLAGYIALLVFPFVAYFALEDLQYLKQTAVAYAANYAIGLGCYVILISYGPRNVIPDVVTQPLYTTYPEAQLFTSAVNANTNVFPSLHASLAITVALLAVRTRAVYQRWAVLALPVAGSVVFATLYLGIHWVTDVVAGGLLAGFSVWLAGRRWDRRLTGGAELREEPVPD